MASSDRELEEQLLEAGNRLLDPPTSVEELLPILDQVENCLLRVEQSPSKSMQNALSPSLKALIGDQLIKHSNVEIKVAVASCISEITRITAPDVPYDDGQMKEVFQLIVSSFENLSDKSNRSYTKRVSILETVAKVRSCVVMLDLECDSLILEMFQHFLKAIREYHPENVFSSMEIIMALVLKESEDISVELLSPILDSVKKDNEEVLPIARKLGERVLGNCSTKLKPYLMQAVKKLGIILGDYSDIVASICQEASAPVEQNNISSASKNMADDSKYVRTSADEASQEDKGKPSVGATPEQVDPVDDKCTELVTGNGVALVEGELSEDSKKEKEEVHPVDQSKELEPDNLDSEKTLGAEEKPEQARGETNSLLNAVESTSVDNEESDKPPGPVADGKDTPGSPFEGPSVEALPSGNEVEINGTSQKVLENESVNVASPSLSGSLLDESHSKRSGRTKRKESSNKEVTPSTDDVSKKVSERTSDSEAKVTRRSGKKVPTGVSDENKATATENELKKESNTASDEKEKVLKHTSKKDGGSKNDGLTSLKLSEVKKRRGQGKAISEEDVPKLLIKDDKKKSTSKSAKEEHNLEETPKTSSKRKRTPGKEGSDFKDGESLVGVKIKVWWPRDRTFYDGVIASFDPAKQKHTVSYIDGDEELLNLKRERWEFIEADSDTEQGQRTDRESPDTSPDIPQKKKTKPNSDESAKRGKMDASAKKGGIASSGKSQGAATKSGRSSTNVGEGKGKSKDSSSKTSGKSTDDSPHSKAKDNASRSGGSKSSDVAQKTSTRLKNDEIDTCKTRKSKADETSTQETPKSVKSKPETPKTASTSKGKTPKSGSEKSNVNGTSKVTFFSSKTKESGDGTERMKGKSSSSSKAQASDTRTGEKRKRGAKR